MRSVSGAVHVNVEAGLGSFLASTKFLGNRDQFDVEYLAEMIGEKEEEEEECSPWISTHP